MSIDSIRFLPRIQLDCWPHAERGGFHADAETANTSGVFVIHRPTEGHSNLQEARIHPLTIIIDKRIDAVVATLSGLVKVDSNLASPRLNSVIDMLTNG